jgi:hypothetical protein
MTKEQLKQALDVCSEYEECAKCPAFPFCGDLVNVTGAALDEIETLEKSADEKARDTATAILTALIEAEKLYQSPPDGVRMMTLYKLLERFGNHNAEVTNEKGNH